jgi:ParB family chromosome partitioning protein
VSDAIRLDIADITVGPRFRRQVGDLSALVESIESVGLLHPIVVTPEFEMVAGRRRLEACKKLGWVDIPCRVLPLSPVEMLMAERDENAVRLDFRPSEMVAIGRRLEEEVARQRSDNRTANLPQSGDSPLWERGKTRDIVGRSLGVAGSTYQKAKQVVEAAEQDPATFGDLPDRMDEVGNVWPIHKEMQTRKEGKAPNTTPKVRLMPIAAAGQIVQNVSHSLHAAVSALEKIETTGVNEVEVAEWISDLEVPLRQIRKTIRAWKERDLCAS